MISRKITIHDIEYTVSANTLKGLNESVAYLQETLKAEEEFISTQPNVIPDVIPQDTNVIPDVISDDNNVTKKSKVETPKSPVKRTRKKPATK